MDGKKGAVCRALSLFIPCFVAVGVVIVQLWLSSRYMSIDLSIVNVLCVACIALDLAQAVSESNNAWKARGFTASVAIAIIAAIPNVISDTEESGFSLASLSHGSWLWGALLALSSVSLAIVLIRLFRWNQDGWEQHRQSRQEIMSERRRMRLELIKQKATARIEKQKDILQKQTVIRQVWHDQLLKIFAKSGSNGNRKIASLVLVIVIVILFFCMPFFKSLNSSVHEWLQSAYELAEGSQSNVEDVQDNNVKSNEDLAQPDSRQNTPSPASSDSFSKLVKYLRFFILVISGICIGFYLLFLLIKFFSKITLALFASDDNKPLKKYPDNGLKFLAGSESSIALLVVLLCALWALTSGTSTDDPAWNQFDFNRMLHVAQNLLKSILLLLIGLVSVELVQIVLEQIVEKHSLLKRLIFLLFASVLDLLSDILLSIISSLKLILVVTSLPELMIPEDWLYLKNRIQEKLNKMFHDVVRHGGSAPNARSVKTRLTRRHIWRRKK